MNDSFATFFFQDKELRYRFIYNHFPTLHEEVITYLWYSDSRFDNDALGYYPFLEVHSFLCQMLLNYLKLQFNFLFWFGFRTL